MFSHNIKLTLVLCEGYLVGSEVHVKMIITHILLKYVTNIHYYI